jgi:hypothetical protein
VGFLERTYNGRNGDFLKRNPTMAKKGETK